jgi:hypothetical protein
MTSDGNGERGEVSSLAACRRRIGSSKYHSLPTMTCDSGQAQAYREH